MEYHVYRNATSNTDLATVVWLSYSFVVRLLVMPFTDPIPLNNPGLPITSRAILATCNTKKDRWPMQNHSMTYV